MKHLGYTPHFYGDRPRLVEDTDYATMRVRKTHDFHHIVTGFSMIGPSELGVIAITALQYGYPAFMTLDLGAIALSMMRVEDGASTSATCARAETWRTGSSRS